MEENLMNATLRPGEVPETPQVDPAATGAQQTTYDPNVAADASQYSNIAGGRTQAPSLNGLSLVAASRRAAYQTGLCEEGKKYQEILKKRLADLDPSLAVRPVSSPDGSLVIEGDGKLIILIFSETMHDKEDNFPSIGLKNQANNAVATLFADQGEVTVVSTIVVTPDDYRKATVMADWISNVFRFMREIGPSTDLNVAMASGRLEITHDRNAYRNFVESVNPHGVDARCDIPMTVYIVTNDNNDFRYDDFGRRIEIPNRRPIAAIGAYVDFSRSLSLNRYIPEVHISEITTTIPSENFIPLYLGLAVYHLIGQSAWRTQFTATMGSKGLPDVCNLVDDPSRPDEHIPMSAIDPSQIDQVLATVCDSPRVLVDVVDGRAMIPGFEVYAPECDDRGVPKYEAAQDLLTVVSGFLDLRDDQIAVLATKGIVQQAFSAYVGTYAGPAGMGGSLDSRYMDYLMCLATQTTDRVHAAGLLMRNYDPRFRYNVQKEYCGTTLAIHYVMRACSLTPDAMNIIIPFITQYLNQTAGATVGGCVDMAAFGGYGVAPGMTTQVAWGAPYAVPPYQCPTGVPAWGAVPPQPQMYGQSQPQPAPQPQYWGQPPVR